MKKHDIGNEIVIFFPHNCVMLGWPDKMCGERGHKIICKHLGSLKIGIIC